MNKDRRGLIQLSFDALFIKMRFELAEKMITEVCLFQSFALKVQFYFQPEGGGKH